MRLITGIDQGSFDHGVEIRHAFKKVRALRDLIRRGRGSIFRSDFPGSRNNGTRHKKRQQALKNHVERHRAIHQVIFMVPVAVPLPVGVVLVQHVPFHRPVHGLQALGGHEFSRAFIRDQFSSGTALRRRILGMRPVHVQATAVRQEFVERPVILGTRTFAFAFDFKPARVAQGIFVFVIPNGLWGNERRVLTDQVEGILNGIGRVDVTRGDAKFRFCADNALQGLSISKGTTSNARHSRFLSRVFLPSRGSRSARG